MEDESSTVHKAQAGPNGLEDNEGLYYAYSIDHGETWQSSSQEMITFLSHRPGSGLDCQDTRLRIKNIPQNSGIMNQKAQYVDTRSGFHVLNRESTAGQEAWMHYYRPPSGGRWVFTTISFIHPTSTGPRGKLEDCTALNTLFLILPSNTADELVIMRSYGFSAAFLSWE